MSFDQFAENFREEHRQIRDSLLGLIEALKDRNGPEAQRLINLIATLTGPHFRYEEEALYPALVEIFGETYIEKLLHDHDLAIRTARKLSELTAKGALTSEDAAKGIEWTKTILPHVSDCEGLSIMVERLPKEKVQAILEARTRSREANLNLLQWDSDVRIRTPLSPT